MARWFWDGKYTDLMTGSAPTSLDSSAACFGIVEGSADLDFGKCGSVRTGDLSILAADINTAGSPRQPRTHNTQPLLDAGRITR